MTTLLVDANNMSYRAKYAYNLAFQGRDTSVLYGVIRMLMSLVKKYKPRSVIMCWDGGIPNFRRELVPSYKQNRKGKKDTEEYQQLLDQMLELQRLIPAFGILSIQRMGIEADDLLYHAAKMVSDECLIVTTDDDLCQAIDEHISVLKPGKKETIIDLESLEFGVNRFVAWKVYQGDKSDNIPGITGIGPVTATKIITKQSYPDKFTKRITDFVISGDYIKAYDCMDLSVDKVGARYIILEAIYRKFQYKTCLSWCLELGFTSIIEAGSLSMFAKLKKPEFELEVIRSPRIWDYKRE